MSLAVPRSLFRLALSRPYSTATAVDVLANNDPTQARVMVESMSTNGFTVNGVKMAGSVALFPRSSFLWKVSSVKDITPESLTLFRLMNPPIELLILGVGQKIVLLDPAVRQYLKDHKINVEVLDTMHAASTFNFLSQEGRQVAAGLIP